MSCSRVLGVVLVLVSPLASAQDSEPAPTQGPPGQGIDAGVALLTASWVSNSLLLLDGQYLSTTGPAGAACPMFGGPAVAPPMLGASVDEAGGVCTFGQQRFDLADAGLATLVSATNGFSVVADFAPHPDGEPRLQVVRVALNPAASWTVKADDRTLYTGTTATAILGAAPLSLVAADTSTLSWEPDDAGLGVVTVTAFAGPTTRIALTEIPLRIEPATLMVPSGRTRTLQARGGNGRGGAWALSSAPSGGSIDPVSGVYAAGPTFGTTDVVTLTDARGRSATATVFVIEPLSVTPPVAVVATDGGADFSVRGGTGAWSCAVIDGGSGGSAVATDAGVCRYLAGAQPGLDVVGVVDVDLAQVEVQVSVVPPLSVHAASTTVAPRGSLDLSTTGGVGGAVVWSFELNRSGGALDANGHYVAGATPEVVDVVNARDSAGLLARFSISVGPGVSLNSTGATPVFSGTVLQWTASGGSGAGFTWSLSTNGSGATIDPQSGVYRAGVTAPAEDTVQAVDSLGNVGRVVVSVSAPPDAGTDAGVQDAGVSDAGVQDAGVDDAGTSPRADAGAPTDAGTGPAPMPTGCGCLSATGTAWWASLLVLVLRWRRRA